jgi:hypothetical protein
MSPRQAGAGFQTAAMVFVLIVAGAMIWLASSRTAIELLLAWLSSHLWLAVAGCVAMLITVVAGTIHNRRSEARAGARDGR